MNVESEVQLRTFHNLLSQAAYTTRLQALSNHRGMKCAMILLRCEWTW